MQLARGESKIFTFTCTDAGGEPIDLEDAEVTFTVYGLDGETVFTLTSASADEIEITDDSGGVFDVKITAELSDIDPTARWADCVVLTDAGQTIKVAEHEPFYVTGI